MVVFPAKQMVSVTEIAVQLVRSPIVAGTAYNADPELKVRWHLSWIHHQG